MKKIIKKMLLYLAGLLNAEEEKWSVKIERANNGFILTENSYGEKSLHVFQESAETLKYPEPDKQYYVNMLYEINDFFNIDSNGKHSRQRLEIKLRKGCKYEKE